MSGEGLFTGLVNKVRERLWRYKGTPWRIRNKMMVSSFRNNVLKSPHVFRIELINTLKCNAKCWFCSNHKLSEEVSVMPEATVRKIFDRAQDDGTPSIVFLGGESLVDRNFDRHLELFSTANMHIGIQSNGTLLTRERLERFKKLGVSVIAVTLHDADPEKHDAVYEVNGAFHVFDEAVTICKEIGIEMRAKAIYSKQSIRDGSLERIIEYAKRRDLKLNVNPFMPVGGGVKEEELLADAEIDRLVELLLSDNRFSFHSVSARQKARCPAGRTYVGITPRGEMLPCYFMPFSLGNVADTSFAQYMDRCQEYPIFQHDALPAGYCVVAQSREFFRDFLKPLYDSGVYLPVDLSKDHELAARLKAFRPDPASYESTGGGDRMPEGCPAASA